jgi:hypothetical protein
MTAYLYIDDVAIGGAGRLSDRQIDLSHRLGLTPVKLSV